MDQDVQPADMRIETGDQLVESTEDAPAADDGKVSAVEAFAHAIAMNAHQHAGVVEEDAPATAVRLPFPRPAFDQDKHMALMFDQLARIDALKIEALKADDHAKRASELKKDAHQAVADAHEELDRQVRILRDEHAAAGDEPEPVQLPLTASGRTPCAWEREHPLEVCSLCTADRHAAEHLVTDAPNVVVTDAPAFELGAIVRTRIDDAIHYLTAQGDTYIWQPERAAATVFADDSTAVLFSTPFANDYVLEIIPSDRVEPEEARVLPKRNGRRKKGG